MTVSETRLREALETLIAALAKICPIETRNTPDYAELTFGDHQTQAMTMQPADWDDIEAAYLDARSALTEQQPTTSGVEVEHNEEVVERVARAICAEFHKDSQFTTWEDEWQDWQDEARVAIAALAASPPASIPESGEGV
jgi:hypothetical protein